MLNGVTQLAVTKVDVLNKLPNIRTARQYRIDGTETDQLPYDLCDTEVTPVYADYPGWEQSLENVQSYEELPSQAREYIQVLEAELGVPVSMVSTGPGRKQLLEKKG
jgi:adenylosuccinate synthase